MLVTNNSDYIRRLNQDGTHFFYPGLEAPHVYMHAWVLGCFYSHISIQTFLRALTMSVDSCVDIKSAPFSGVTKSGSLEEGAGKQCWGGGGGGRT